MVNTSLRHFRLTFLP